MVEAGKPTVIDIVLEYLETQKDTEITTHEIENKIPLYAESRHNIRCTAGTVGRKFRVIKNNPDMLATRRIALQNVSERHPRRKENTWAIASLN